MTIMKKAFKHIPTLVAAVVMGSLFVACTDDDNYSIKEAKIDINPTTLGQLEAYSYSTADTSTKDQRGFCRSKRKERQGGCRKNRHLRLPLSGRAGTD